MLRKELKEPKIKTLFLLMLSSLADALIISGPIFLLFAFDIYKYKYIYLYI